VQGLECIAVLTHTAELERLFEQLAQSVCLCGMNDLAYSRSDYGSPPGRSLLFGKSEDKGSGTRQGKKQTICLDLAVE